MDRLPVTTFAITLPNPVGSGNALILGIQFNTAVAVASVSDDKGNNWVAGPTTVNGSTKMSLYYALGAIGGTQQVSVTFTGSTSTDASPQAVLSEFYNVASFDSGAISPNSLSESLTTSAPGDLIYQWGVDFSDTNGNGGAYNGSSLIAGSGFTLLSADLQVGSCDQFSVQAVAGPISPSFSASGSSTWGSLALALKCGSVGTLPPPGIRIVHVQHTLLDSVFSGQNRPNPIVMQFPSSGNLLVGSYNSGDVTIQSVSDGLGNNWSVPASAVTLGGRNVTPAQIVYAANASTSSTLSGISVKLTGTTQSDAMFVLYDVVGASSTPFETASAKSGNQTTSGNLSTVSITPTVSNGLVICVGSIYEDTINGTVGTGFILDAVVNSFDTDSGSGPSSITSTLDENNPYAHIYTTGTGPLTFVFTYNPAFSPCGYWGVVAVAFAGQ
jgi:hypothetical protein